MAADDEKITDDELFDALLVGFGGRVELHEMVTPSHYTAEPGEVLASIRDRVEEDPRAAAETMFAIAVLHAAHESGHDENNLFQGVLRRLEEREGAEGIRPKAPDAPD